MGSRNFCNMVIQSNFLIDFCFERGMLFFGEKDRHDLQEPLFDWPVLFDFELPLFDLYSSELDVRRSSFES